MVSLSTKSICLDRHPNPKGGAPRRLPGPGTLTPPLIPGSLAPVGWGAPCVLGQRVPGGSAYSAALATRAFSASSKDSMRRAVAIGDFVNRASML